MFDKSAELYDLSYLGLDLWASADGRTVLRLDEDEFAASGRTTTDPVAATRALDALAELERLARTDFAGVDLQAIHQA